MNRDGPEDWSRVQDSNGTTQEFKGGYQAVRYVLQQQPAPVVSVIAVADVQLVTVEI